jgi:hypothetical protein
MDEKPEYAWKCNGLIWPSLILGLSLIVCAVLIGSTLVKVKGQGRTIRVTGAAYKPITSDYALWEGWLSASATTLDAAYTRMKNGLEVVEAFLSQEGLSSGQYEEGTVTISRNFDRERNPTGYVLGQLFKLESSDVNRMAALGKKASSLIEKGIEFESRPVQYIFTGLESLKLEMIKAATQNAKERAQQLAESTDRKVGAPVSASVGVFQIRPQHSQEVSDYGVSDQSSIAKEIVCTVHIDFLIE